MAAVRDDRQTTLNKSQPVSSLLYRVGISLGLIRDRSRTTHEKRSLASMRPDQKEAFRELQGLVQHAPLNDWVHRRTAHEVSFVLQKGTRSYTVRFRTMSLNPDGSEKRDYAFVIRSTVGGKQTFIVGLNLSPVAEELFGRLQARQALENARLPKRKAS